MELINANTRNARKAEHALLLWTRTLVYILSFGLLMVNLAALLRLQLSGNATAYALLLLSAAVIILGAMTDGILMKYGPGGRLSRGPVVSCFTATALGMFGLLTAADMLVRL